MAWDRILRVAAWICFALMWIALALFILNDSPATPEESTLGFILAFPFLLTLFLVLLFLSYTGPLVAAWYDARLVRRQGMLVPAEIKSLDDTGISVNRQPVVDVTLTVRPPYEEAFEATIRMRMRFSVRPDFRPGTKLQVFYIFGTHRIALPE
ncbi:MAG: hypothetical protein GYA23_02965 [Methanomicrobiales archaeon]|nr:hypothetical protein [Methanomicrobiales archaeon]